MSKQERSAGTVPVEASVAPHEHFFTWVEETTRKRFAAGDTGEQPPTLFLYRTHADEPLPYDGPDDGAETRNVISALLGWDGCVGVGYVTHATLEAFPDPRLAQCPPQEAPPKPLRVEAIVGVFHSPHELPRMIRVEIEGRGAHRRIGKVRTDFTPTPSAIISPTHCGAHEAHGSGEASAVPQIVRGTGPTIVMLP